MSLIPCMQYICTTATHTCTAVCSDHVINHMLHARPRPRPRRGSIHMYSYRTWPTHVHVLHMYSPSAACMHTSLLWALPTFYPKLASFYMMLGYIYIYIYYILLPLVNFTCMAGGCDIVYVVSLY